MKPVVAPDVLDAVWPHMEADGVVGARAFPGGPADAALIGGDALNGILLRRDGTAWLSLGQESLPVSDRLAIPYVVWASRRWPQLQPALPTRETESVDCDLCQGSGIAMVPGGVRETFCLRCSGLGWLDASVEPRSAFEPPSLPNFGSVRALIEHDQVTPLDDSDFDSALWMLLVRQLDSPETAARAPEPVVVYYASRYLQWEVGNGGFAQAAYNIPEWFELAERGYRALGKPAEAALIAEARAMLPGELETLNQQNLLTATIGGVFEHFEESAIAELDARLADCEWECDEERVAYVRRHREVFRQLAEK